MKLSVIVPVYNCEQYLVRCFDHLIHSEVQVIIVNDGSTDGSKWGLLILIVRNILILWLFISENKVL